MRLAAALTILLAISGVADPGWAQQNANPEILFWPVRGNVYVVAGAGANIAMSVGVDGVLLVDSGSAEMTDKLIAAVQQFLRQRNPTGPVLPIRYIINTSPDVDHVGGNAKIAESAIFKPLPGGEQIIAQDNALHRIIDARLPFKARPTDTYTTEQYRVNRFFNGEGVQVIHMPAAHSDGDSVVNFRYSDVIATGDVFTYDYPVIDIDKGGSIQGVLKGLNQLIDLVFPEFRSQGGTMLIPGHGRVSDLTDLAYYRDMVTIIRDRIEDMRKKGMTLEQVKAAKPTLDYDPIYGKKAGSADRFVEAVYRGLGAKP